MKSDIEQVVDACRRKDAKAQKRLYDEYAPKMLGICMRYTHSRDEAQDLLHDGFIKIFENIDKLQNPLAVEAWMKQIMVRIAINYVVRNRNIYYTDISQLPDNIWTEDPEKNEEGTTPPCSLSQIVSAIQSLPQPYRIVFNLHEVEEMDFNEIAHRLHRPEVTIRSALSRARKMLKEKLTPIIENNKKE